jgi:ketosteroid isomerase-like protein
MKLLTVLFAVILLAACAAKSSDEQQVRAVIQNVENAAEARDTSDVLAFVADDYSDAQGLDRAQLQNFLRGYFLSHPKIELLVNVESLTFPAEGLAQAEITLTSISTGGADREYLKVEFRRNGSAWRVNRADRASR